LREELQRSRNERERTLRSLEQVEAENRDYSARYVEVETHNCNLMNLHVAMLRLHGTLSRQDVLAVAQDIIVNVLGSEELGLFLLDASGRELVLASSLGVDEARWARVPLERGVLGATARTGRAFLAKSGDDAVRGEGEETLTACIPLTRVGVVIGVIAVFRLLRHKPALEAFDHDLLNLLGTQVGMALHATRAAGAKDSL
jgi:putative methionine-R-sulfoxide reductase with GAF domain